MVIVWRLRGNIIRTAQCWILWHSVHSPQHTYASSSYRSNRLDLSHWDPYAVRRGGCLEQWRIQDFCEGDAAGVWPPIFSEEMTTTFLRQIVSAHRRSQDFQRVGAPRGGSRISGWGRWRDRKPRTRRGRREAAERRGWWSRGRGAVAPPRYGGLGA